MEINVIEILEKLKEALEAEKLVRISSAHVSGISYFNVGEAGIDFLEKLVNECLKVKVPTTINPAGMDLEKWHEMGIPSWFAKRQIKIIELLKTIGASPTCTCTPYLVGNVPRRGSHVAWAESSAVVYANSIIGAKTNREGGPSSILAAIAGYTVCSGYHLDENRIPNLKVKVKAKIGSEVDQGLLGYIVAQRHPTAIPLFDKITLKHMHLKSMCAALATSGQIALFSWLPRCGQYSKIADKTVIDQGDISLTREKLSTLSEISDSDVIYLGCPHLSLQEIASFTKLLCRKNAKPKIKIWLGTSREIYRKCIRIGILEKLKKRNVEIICDMCIVVAPLKHMGIKCITVNSVKAAHYLRKLHNVKVHLASMEEIINAC